MPDESKFAIYCTDDDGKKHRTLFPIDIIIIDLTGRKIRSIDLTPLSGCSNLISLNLSLNKIEKLDLTPLKECKQFYHLNLFENKLEEIDLSPLSQCPNFELLNLDFNPLKKLNWQQLGNLKALKSLSARFLRYGKIDLGPLEIDLSPLSNCVNLMELSIGVNSLREVDLSPLSKCADLNLLAIDGNNLKSIDLEPLRACNKLRALFLENNELTSIDLTPLSENRELGAIHLQSNQIEYIDLGPLENATQLQELVLDDNKIVQLDISPLFNCFNLWKNTNRPGFEFDQSVELSANKDLRNKPDKPRAIELLIEEGKVFFRDPLEISMERISASTETTETLVTEIHSGFWESRTVSKFDIGYTVFAIVIGGIASNLVSNLIQNYGVLAIGSWILVSILALVMRELHDRKYRR